MVREAVATGVLFLLPRRWVVVRQVVVREVVAKVMLVGDDKIFFYTCRYDYGRLAVVTI